MTDSESNELKSRRRQSCSVCDSNAAVDARATSHCPCRVYHLERHCVTDGFFALSMRIAKPCVEHGVLRCHLLIAIDEANSSPVAVCRCEQGDRPSGLDVDEANTIYNI